MKKRVLISFALNGPIFYNLVVMNEQNLTDLLSSGKELVLYADIGNSTIDFLLTDFDSFATKKIPTRHKSEIVSYLETLAGLSDVYVSSVNSIGLEALKHGLDKVFPNAKLHLLTPQVMGEYALRAGIKVDNIDILGSDLFCDIVSESNNSGEIIIDLGTASKILYLDKSSYFHGCQIFPGLASFPETLHAKTDLLKNAPIIENPPLISLKTEECISSGVINGVSALISKMVETIEREYDNDDAKVILTGGNAYLIKDALNKFTNKEIIYDPYHIIKGMMKISGHDYSILKIEKR